MFRPDPTNDHAVEAELCGSLTITEDGQLLPTRNQFGAVTDRFGVYRMPDEPDPTDPDYYRDSGPGRWG